MDSPVKYWQIFSILLILLWVNQHFFADRDLSARTPILISFSFLFDLVWDYFIIELHIWNRSNTHFSLSRFFFSLSFLSLFLSLSICIYFYLYLYLSLSMYCISPFLFYLYLYLFICTISLPFFLSLSSLHFFLHYTHSKKNIILFTNVIARNHHNRNKQLPEIILTVFFSG